MTDSRVASEAPANLAAPPPARDPASPGARGWPAGPTLILVAASLVLLLAHSWLYRFLCDDAFISFRYSVNLAHGHGLVFNPGMERVEGYSNFLWVLILAGLDVVGIRPEQAAAPLLLLFTVALWALVAWFAWRQRLAKEPMWLAAVPVLYLAVTRSIAVWSSSGLETRLFEALVVAGALRLIVEVEARERGESPRGLAAWAFALATLTRPDALLISLVAFAAAGLHLRRRSRAAFTRWIGSTVPFFVIVGLHFVFRRIYYGDWLPNTYYAKVDGRTWWSSGFTYLAAFALEYGAIFWLPLVALGAWWNAARGRALVPMVFGAVVIPHALYVASIGGDHFEYRMLDLYFPFLFLLAADGLRALTERRVAQPLTAAWFVVAGVGLWELPWQSHRQFPRYYITGFPGVPLSHEVLAQEYLDPARDPIYRWFPLTPLAVLHRNELRELTANFVGVRQEEHRMFLATVVPEGHRLRQLMDDGTLPRDVYVAMGSVGAIPYYSDVRTLDRVGLTDAHVAHSPVVRRRLMAHDKDATIEYARDRGVDLWTQHPVHLIENASDRALLSAIRDGMLQGKDGWAAPVSDSEYIVCRLPKGLEASERRMPKLHFVPVTDSAFIAGWAAKAGRSLEVLIARDSTDYQTRGELAFIQLMSQQYASAAANFAKVVEAAPRSPEALEYLGLCRFQIGERQAGLDALENAIEQYRGVGDLAAAARVESERIVLMRTMPAKAGSVGEGAKPKTR